MNNRALLLFFLFITFHLRSYAQWNSFITNYNREEFGNGSQTWCVYSYDDHWTYFANRNGILQFDGKEWLRFPMKNGTEARSVHQSGDKLYISGINEFGYLSVSERGTMEYICLSDSFPDALQLGNVWKIHEIDNVLYFCADGRILKRINNNFTTIVSERKIDCSNVVNGSLYIGTDKGVFMLVGNTLLAPKGMEKLEGKRIRGILPYREGLIVVTAYDGFFYYDYTSCEPLPTAADRFMQKNEAFCVEISDEKIAVGTIQKGVVLIDLSDGSVRYFNENNGLQNNTVLSLGFDRKGNLWAGLDNGIDYILLDYPMTNLYSRMKSYGTGYSAILADDKLYLGTNRGLFVTDYPVQINEDQIPIRSVPNSGGQVWGLKRVGGDVFCLHDRGLFLLAEERLEKIADISGAWSLIEPMGHPGKLLVGTYSEAYLLEKTEGKWTLSGKIENISDAMYNLEQADDTTFWLHNSSRGVERITLDVQGLKAREIRFFGTESGLPSNNEVFVNKIDDRICFTTPEGIFRYDAEKDRMVPDEAMNRRLNNNSSVVRVIEHGHGSLMALSSQEITLIGENSSRTFPFRHKFVEPVRTLETLVPIADSLIIIPNDYGFALLHLEPGVQPDLSPGERLINKVFLIGSKDSLLYSNNYLQKEFTPVLPYKGANLRFEYGSWRDQRKYQYRLSGNERWSDFTFSQTKEYNNLSEGDYTFFVRSIDTDGTIGEERFRFRIEAPWYRSLTAYILYGILLLLLGWFVYWWDDRRVQKKQAEIAEQKNRELIAKEQAYEQENERKEQQIIALEKEKLEHELHYKSQEMANLMINFARKNEALTDIRQELQKVIGVLKNDRSREARQMLMVVNSNIDDNIQSDEVLKRIEEQFDIVHNNFTKRLGEKHPSLTQNERMMCAYLKMNLASKEIAPLLNISVRGVETIRYRLRKKLSLEREQSLIDYLNNDI